ncbi:MAG TPA: phosphopentomutase [Thermomonas sp.]|uniref:phosphopentomutase n=1 Tax=Thermomonas sp. TaxID=1971895 RepID=UPI002BAE3E3C|nr:phosphopentomutase [Thermomonas sp.]HQW58634.1 phosphopentomutase [Thermomonas sp.]HQY82042.1 phosphopentomutase [Thermomonas sp.]
MARALLVVVDSLGIGGAADAGRFGDTGADTFGHILQARAPALPNLRALGLHAAHALAHGRAPATDERADPASTWAAMQEHSTGKDTTSGHWEMCGVPVEFDWGYFTAPEHSFPPDLLDALCSRAGLAGVLGNCRASGTEIIERLGREHLASGKPIVYTSADSVLQIAAHEQHFGLERLYATCRIARELVDDYRIARVIARPFAGDAVDGFRRTGNRHDYSVPPTAPTLLDALVAAGHQVLAIGKVSDIFAGQGISRAIPASGLPALLDATEATFADAPDGSLVFVNLVDFDSEYGHRRDVAGYAAALEYFDARLPALLRLAQAGDLVLLTADHGNDPTWPGSDHTRECVPLLAVGGGLRTGAAGLRDGFADLGQTLARHFGLPPLRHGVALPLSS